MNRYLLAGAAAAALAFGAGAANAQAKFEVKVGGDAFFEAGYVDQDLDSGLRSTEFRNRFRVNIIPSAKADNGLEYGGRIRLRANSSGGTVDSDHAYVFVQGGFGQVRMGVTSSVNDDTYASRPIDSMFLGQSTPWDVYVSGNNNSAGLALPYHNYSLVPENNSTKIYYVSPRFSGFQIGASYTPRSDDKNNSIDRRKNVVNYQDMYEVAANYNGTFSGVKLSASAGFFGGEARTTVGGANREDLRAWQVGAQVGYAGFAIGGGYTNQGDSGYTSGSTGQDAYSWNAGLQYTTGPIVVGAGYTYGQDSSSGASAGDQDMDVWSVSAAYTVAPGLTVGAEYDYFDVNRTGSTLDDKGSIAMVRSVLAF